MKTSYMILTLAFATIVLLVAVLFAIPAIKMHTMLDRRCSCEPYSAADYDISSRPALLVHSTGDGIVPFANFEQLIAAAPAVQRWVVEGDNHCILEDFTHPEHNSDYCSVILNFLDSIARR